MFEIRNGVPVSRGSRGPRSMDTHLGRTYSSFLFLLHVGILSSASLLFPVLPLLLPFQIFLRFLFLLELALFRVAICITVTFKSLASEPTCL